MCGSRRGASGDRRGKRVDVPGPRRRYPECRRSVCQRGRARQPVRRQLQSAAETSADPGASSRCGRNHRLPRHSRMSELLRQLSRADLWAVRHTVTGTRSGMRFRPGREVHSDAGSTHRLRSPNPRRGWDHRVDRQRRRRTHGINCGTVQVEVDPPASNLRWPCRAGTRDRFLGQVVQQHQASITRSRRGDWVSLGPGK